MAAAAWKARKLNEVLPRLQDQFEAALNEGALLELTPGDVAWVRDAFDEVSA